MNRFTRKAVCHLDAERRERVLIVRLCRKETEGRLNESIKRLGEQLNAVNKKLALWRKTARNYMHPKEFSRMLHVINQIRPPRITIMSVARSVKNMIEKNIF